MKDDIIVFLATVKDREPVLKLVIKDIYDQVDKIHLILNWYDEVPAWISVLKKIHIHVNPHNKNAHDSIWIYLDAENEIEKINGEGRYYFILDDDLAYPADYFEKLIESIELHKRRAVITCHGSNIMRPVESYFDCRKTYGFSDRVLRDIFVDMVGVGCCAFHSSTIKPTLQNFLLPYCRDLYFSILCHRRGVPIITPNRPLDWIKGYKTGGDSVYEISKSNETLRRLKDRVLKEQLLPLLFLDKTDDKFSLITEYDFDKRLLLKTLATLDSVCKSNTIVFSNRLKMYAPGNVLTQFVDPAEIKIGRAGSKIITHFRFIKGLPNNSKVISMDADLYFLKNPFEAFEMDFDVAVTTRPEPYHYPINQGVVMIKVNDKVRNFLDYLSGQIFDRTWPELIEWQKRFGHTGNDWCIGQDLMCVAYVHKDYIWRLFGVKIVDIGPQFNFCPHADGEATEQGKAKLMQAYNMKSVHVLHLKSRLKELLYEGKLR